MKTMMIRTTTLLRLALLYSLAAPPSALAQWELIVEDPMAATGAVEVIWTEERRLVARTNGRDTAISSVRYDSAGRLILTRSIKDGDIAQESRAYYPAIGMSVTVRTYNDRITEYSIALHDIEGNITERTRYYPRGGAFSHSTCSYNSQGGVLRYCHEDVGRLRSATSFIYEYDQLGRISGMLYGTGVEKPEWIPTAYTYERFYDGTPEEIHITTESRREDGTEYSFSSFYTPSGRLLREDRYEREIGDPRPRSLIWSFQYDELGRLSVQLQRGVNRRFSYPGSTPGMVVSAMRTDTSMWRGTFFQYDDHGNQFRLTTFTYNSHEDFVRRNGKEEWDERAEYSYDNQGNWIEAMIYTDGGPSRKIIRRITYYPDGYRTARKFLPDLPFAE